MNLTTPDRQGTRHWAQCRSLSPPHSSRLNRTGIRRQSTSFLLPSLSQRIAFASHRVVDLLTRQPTWHRGKSISLIAGMVAGVGIIDYVTSAYISFRPFYYIPIALSVSWFGWAAGSVTSVFSVFVWIVGDYHAGSPWIRGPGFVAVWNTGIALVTFHIMVWTLQVLIALHRDMERRIRERTRSLQEAVEQQDRLRRELVEVGTRERSAVGRELHDGLCQHLAATAFATQIHVDRLAQINPAEAENARALVRMTQQAITQSRQVASGLLHSGINPLTLTSELSEFATAVSRQGSVACRFEQDGSPRAPDAEVAEQLFRIAQEAVRNALKHARPGMIRVALAGDERQVRLSVVDDGIGIPPPDRREFGMGLEIMAHRAGSIGASFAVDALPTGGTRVMCRWGGPAAG